MNRKVIIRVKKIEGNCVVYSGGEQITIRGAEVVLDKTDKICIHAFSVLAHYIIPLREGINPAKLGLTTDSRSRKGYVACVDPGPPYTNGGRVVFELEAVNNTD